MKRPRLRVWHLLVGLALVAAALGVARHRIVASERAQLARLRTDLERAEDRVKWVEAMLRARYKSPSTVGRERMLRDLAKKNLEGFRPLFLDVGE